MPQKIHRSCRTYLAERMMYTLQERMMYKRNNFKNGRLSVLFAHTGLQAIFAARKNHNEECRDHLCPERDGAMMMMIVPNLRHSKGSKGSNVLVQGYFFFALHHAHRLIRKWVPLSLFYLLAFALLRSVRELPS